LGGGPAGFTEEKLGSLEPGKYADLVVLSQDLFEVDPEEIPGEQVRMTLVEGKIVCRNEE
jgi:predicted amidohydrolase YtcJ